MTIQERDWIAGVDVQCNACGEVFPETGDGYCPFCGSSDVTELDDEE